MYQLHNGVALMRSASLIIGVVLLVVTTLDAAPSPSDDYKNSVNSIDNCEMFLKNNLGMNVKLPIDAIEDTLFMYNSNDQCSIVYAIVKYMPPSFYTDSLTNDESQRLGILEMLAQLGQNMIRDDLENSKRGLGFGMDRGYSGLQASRHLIGLHAATWPGGPGRRRRSDKKIQYEMNLKRGMGFGMDRGFSGAQAARYLIGAEAANRLGKRMDTHSGDPEE